jgi:hypothetical protein
MRQRHGGGGGPEGNCICLKCGRKAPHQPGTPCRETRCPQCGVTMVREGSEHHHRLRSEGRSRQPHRIQYPTAVCRRSCLALPLRGSRLARSRASPAIAGSHLACGANAWRTDPVAPRALGLGCYGSAVARVETRQQPEITAAVDFFDRRLEFEPPVVEPTQQSAVPQSC